MSDETRNEDEILAEIIEAGAREAFWSDDIGGHHKAGRSPHTFDNIPEVGRENYRRMVRDVLRVVAPMLKSVLEPLLLAELSSVRAEAQRRPSHTQGGDRFVYDGIGKRQLDRLRALLVREDRDALTTWEVVEIAADDLAAARAELAEARRKLAEIRTLVEVMRANPAVTRSWAAFDCLDRIASALAAVGSGDTEPATETPA